MHQLTIVFMFIVLFYTNSFLHQIHLIHKFEYISICQVDTWNDFVDEDRNKLNIGQLRYQTKHGKSCHLYVHLVPARNVKSALTLLVCLFLDHSKVTESFSMVQDSAMLIIKKITNADVFYSNSFGKVNANFACFVIDFYPCCCYLAHILTTMRMLHPLHGRAGIFFMKKQEMIQEN